MEDEIDIEMSSLCQELTDDGKTVQVDVYRGGGSDWHLEVVDEFGNSTVWDDQFPTDQEALNEAKATIRDEGIDSLIGAPS
ncbi:hypothetical protein QWY74_01725 [Halomonas almeriensis]|uniref:hypothetical protein n=1 Tax=Halomonas almeriensis TaxID=308163 RepID=UPI0025B39961|nr:hypothetical protein [Halomonas almeriensis]MDN3552197.1 hypothetical protein [Halomonas almeriensis]